MEESKKPASNYANPMNHIQPKRFGIRADEEEKKEEHDEESSSGSDSSSNSDDSSGSYDDEEDTNEDPTLQFVAQ